MSYTSRNKQTNKQTNKTNYSSNLDLRYEKRERNYTVGLFGIQTFLVSNVLRNYAILPDKAIDQQKLKQNKQIKRIETTAATITTTTKRQTITQARTIPRNVSKPLLVGRHSLRWNPRCHLPIKWVAYPASRSFSGKVTSSDGKHLARWGGKLLC